ncbi:uncharacterized protein CCOS01_07547 [Colletotrichum costaricense]|uniref:Uncharacterized protein n=2 Tax=Colletotrichum acutatum species complex TaxID=2707335 RepID=A0AAI9YWS3_9PEZI|nr:uncharacterized protein CCOS01_07547 [Colletotrichum costaricense]XP_060377913.1 uncharacterized protein CTAM01_11462 [Colletotrichum tamarilloi]KAI3539294.1 hypothetical protein CSPX01_08957 [Colletotrichum filicis]KAK1488239.1 hypothetical protein CTAM01_11462 [Colletotrichum tamarilloi]KAK1527285.1 hypothetical protein CCOS01_07547 [Colletotrichum costaricense]
MGHTATATAPKSDPKDPKGPNVVRAAAYKVPYLVSGQAQSRQKRARKGLPSDKTRAFPRSRLFKASSQSENSSPDHETPPNCTRAGRAAAEPKMRDRLP